MFTIKPGNALEFTAPRPGKRKTAQLLMKRGPPAVLMNFYNKMGIFGNNSLKEIRWRIQRRWW